MARTFIQELGKGGMVTRAYRRGVNVPCAKEDVMVSSVMVNKVFVHPDQIFWSSMIGDPTSCFKYCNSFESMPENTESETGCTFLGKSGMIVVELSQQCSISRVNYGLSKKLGSIQVWVGNNFSDLQHKFTIEEGKSFCDASGRSEKATGKLVVFLAEDGTAMPPVELLTTGKGVQSMPNKEWVPKYVEPKTIFQITDGLRLNRKDLAIVQKSLFPDRLFFITDSWVQSPDSPSLIRLAPTIVNGEAFDIDSELRIIRTQLDSNLDIAVKASNKEFGLKLIRYLVARYGNNKKFRYNRQVDGIAIDSEWVFRNSEGYIMRQNNRAALQYANRFMYFPEKAIIDMDEFCELQVEIFKIIKDADITMPVMSMPMPIDKNFFYFAYRHGLNEIKSVPWDCCVFRVCSDEDLDNLPKVIETFHLYLPHQDFVVIIDYPVFPGRWPAISYQMMMLRCSKLIISNMIDLYDARPGKWDVTFEPTEIYHSFVDWLSQTNGKNTTLVQEIGDVTRVVSCQKGSYNRVEHFMLSANTRAEFSPLVNGLPVVMPIGKTFTY